MHADLKKELFMVGFALACLIVFSAAAAYTSLVPTNLSEPQNSLREGDDNIQLPPPQIHDSMPIINQKTYEKSE